MRKVLKALKVQKFQQVWKMALTQSLDEKEAVSVALPLKKACRLPLPPEHSSLPEILKDPKGEQAFAQASLFSREKFQCRVFQEGKIWLPRENQK